MIHCAFDRHALCDAPSIYCLQRPHPASKRHVPAVDCPKCLVMIDVLLETNRWAVVLMSGLRYLEGDHRMLRVRSDALAFNKTAKRGPTLQTWVGQLKAIWPLEQLGSLVYEDNPFLRMIPRGNGSPSDDFFGIDRGASVNYSVRNFHAGNLGTNAPDWKPPEPRRDRKR